MPLFGAIGSATEHKAETRNVLNCYRLVKHLMNCIHLFHIVCTGVGFTKRFSAFQARFRAARSRQRVGVRWPRAKRNGEHSHVRPAKSKTLKSWSHWPGGLSKPTMQRHGTTPARIDYYWGLPELMSFSASERKNMRRSLGIISLLNNP